MIDISDENHMNQLDVVKDVLGSLGADDKDMLYVYNKCDLFAEVPENTENTAFISAKTGQGIDRMLRLIDTVTAPEYIDIEIELPYSKTALLALIQKNASGPVEVEYLEKMKIKASVPIEIKKKLDSENPG